ncbi:sensor domain-containing diguanylate cyclase [Cohnella herbarum]|uniref:Sensor domain-containing diguanylate cyclase n=1 Tax=Cohnella herbarum TaxID=2728023 RepID=A0A7Z2VL79_9BACL|nr:sensor domain-containing diguanylate cyclase [Cohnella herbarum]QJD84840.1 sensor domain-containing diguanylate cyclase [Cohnella herbarum]
MNDQLNYAPCGFVTLSNTGIITDVNQTLLDLLQYERIELVNRHIETIMTVANKIFFHTYFYPYIQLHGFVNEIYLTLKNKNDLEVPVLLNGARKERDGESYIDCVLIEMRKRIEYERDMLSARNKLEVLNIAKDEALETLKTLHAELGKKQEELIELNRRLESQASTDGLTGARNRRFFQESLAGSLSTFHRLHIPFSLLLLDIDYFKRINDTYGHPVGDEILIKLAKTLQAESREIDIVARYGGEEFAIILPGVDRDNATLIAERCRLTVEQADWGEYGITVSVGAATVTEEDTDETLVVRADQALYASKSRGRNRVTHSDDRSWQEEGGGAD